MEERNKNIITLGVFACLSIIITGFMIPSAWAMMAGTNETIEFSGAVSDCYITNNQSNLEGLNLTMEENRVILSTDVRYKPDTFKVSCLVEGQREVAEEEESGGGGYYTYPWRNKVNQTETNQTINYTEKLETTEEVTFDDEVIVTEEPKSYTGWIVLGILIILGIVFWLVMRE